MPSTLSTIVVLCASSLWCALSASAWGAAEIADAIYLNGRIFIANVVQPWAEAIAVRGNEIVYVGD